ncbi:LON peptidase substrate-binding domain-containing protein [Acidocella sp.]|uniref:LON peptidase substrate-binding domain-containing protein n=1 Tax=Acidocella sp. TaxID=50710 RepID=UPI00260EDD0E|nr:LON peptidase substrate-binding domain-containing protein [Acidocella sp.]
MPVFKPTLGQLPDMFAVFPLGGALLLPGGHLPLNIFEPRYLAMIEDCMGEGRYVGMVQPDPRLPEGENGPGLYRVGCLGRVSSFAETDDGRFLLTLTGVIRFTIVEELEMRRGYRRVQAGLNGFAPDLREADGEGGLPMSRDALVAAMRGYFAAMGISETNWRALLTVNDAALVNALAMACPFTNEEKQALLEARDLGARAAALYALLRIDSFDGGTGGNAPRLS